MPKKKTTSNEQIAIRVGNISDISGNVNIAKGNITTHQATNGLDATDIKKLFDELYSGIDANVHIPSTDKEDIKAEVQEIQSAVTHAAEKQGKLDEGFLSRRLRNIARMAPDILDVVVAALANPLSALGVAVKKIAQKIKEETK